jgi:hypothetical protein
VALIYYTLVVINGSFKYVYIVCVCVPPFSSSMPILQLICYEGGCWSVSTLFLKTGYTKQYGVTSYRTAAFSVPIEFRDKRVSERPPSCECIE